MDTSTTYTSNAAIRGGAIFLSSTPATLSKITFDGNWANQGGSIYLEGTSTVVLSEMKVIKSRALSDGGFMYVQDSAANILI